MFDYDGAYYWGVGESTLPIVGDVALDDLVVVFDQEDNKVGFADAVCDAVPYPPLLTPQKRGKTAKTCAFPRGPSPLAARLHVEAGLPRPGRGLV